MMSARAVARHGAPDGYVDLEFDAVSGCAGCAGACLWRRLESARRARLAVSAPIAPGEVVRVTLPERVVLLASLVLHGLPWLTLLVGAVVGGLLAGSDWGVALGAVVALGSLGALTPIMRRRIERAALAALSVETIR